MLNTVEQTAQFFLEKRRSEIISNFEEMYKNALSSLSTSKMTYKIECGHNTPNEMPRIIFSKPGILDLFLPISPNGKVTTNGCNELQEDELISLLANHIISEEEDLEIDRKAAVFFNPIVYTIMTAMSLSLLYGMYKLVKMDSEQGYEPILSAACVFYSSAVCLLIVICIGEKLGLINKKRLKQLRKA